jgi:hypothetical protein
MPWIGQEGGTNHPTQTPTMATFHIPTGPPISENRLTYCAHRRKAPHTEAPEPGSITYDCEKGGMKREWADYDTFLDWLATEEAANSVEFILSQVERSDLPIWQERRVYRCAREYSGGKLNREKITERERTIPSKKTGCRCCLMIKHYLHTDKILGKYEDRHDHAIGDENLRFTRLSDTTKALVMDMVCTRIDSKAIVRDKTYFYSRSNGYSAKMCAGIFYAKSLQLPHYDTRHYVSLSDRGEQGD